MFDQLESCSSDNENNSSLLFASVYNDIASEFETVKEDQEMPLKGQQPSNAEVEYFLSENARLQTELKIMKQTLSNKDIQLKSKETKLKEMTD